MIQAQESKLQDDEGKPKVQIESANPKLPQTENKPINEIIIKPPLPLPGEDLLLEDLGEGKITGESGYFVEGYSAGLDRMTMELIRLLRKDKLLVVWLFDESESMKDDQQEVKLKRIHEELVLVQQGNPGKPNDLLLTAIASFGKQVHLQTKRPTSKTEEVLAAIDKIPVDKSGVENLCTAVAKLLMEYGKFAQKDNRKVVLIVVTDEAGDDGHLLELALKEAKRIKAPIYCFGRQATFGSLYSHVKWRNPKTGELHFLPIRRGPETPFVELLQHNGYRRRMDAHSTPFASYEQARLCQETLGICFLLPGQEANLVDSTKRKLNERFALREYYPDWSSRAQYQAERDKSPFRKAIWDVIVMLNPFDPKAKNLELPDPAQTRERFSTDPERYGPKVKNRIGHIKHLLATTQKARASLERVKPLRLREPSARWRANYDLLSAQLAWYEVRLIQYALGLDTFVRTGLAEQLKENPKHNRWFLRETPSEFLLPDEQQQKLLGITPEELKKLHAKAIAELSAVRTDYKDTPWGLRAEWELHRKTGVQFQTYAFVVVPPNPKTEKDSKPFPLPKL